MLTQSLLETAAQLTPSVKTWPRRQPGMFMVDGKALRYGDLHSFYYQVRQIFGDQLYDFQSDDAAPVIIDCGAHIGLASLYFKERLAQAQLKDVCHVFKADIKNIAEEFVSSKQNRFNPGKIRIALLYIDCNAFLPAKFSMDFFKSYMSPGGIVCIDEKLQGGETEALVEFCKENGLEFRKDTGPFAIPAYTRVT